MIELTILDFLYLVLIFFTTIIGTLMIIAMLRVLKVLNVAVEIANIYIKIKQILAIYSQIPQIIKEKIKESFKKEDKQES